MKRLHLAAGALLCAVHLGIGADRGRLLHRAEPHGVGQGIGGRRHARLSPGRGAPHLRVVLARASTSGRLPPLIHGVVVVETTVDASGHPRGVKLVRGPSHAPDVTRRGDRDDQARRPAAGADAVRRPGQVHRDLARPQGRPLPARCADRGSGLTLVGAGRSHPGGEAAVDVEDLAGDEARRRRGEEDGGAGELVRLGPAPRRRSLLDPRGELGVGRSARCSSRCGRTPARSR